MSRHIIPLIIHYNSCTRSLCLGVINLFFTGALTTEKNLEKKLFVLYKPINTVFCYMLLLYYIIFTHYVLNPLQIILNIFPMPHSEWHFISIWAKLKLYILY